MVKLKLSPLKQQIKAFDNKDRKLTSNAIPPKTRPPKTKIQTSSH